MLVDFARGFLDDGVYQGAQGVKLILVALKNEEVPAAAGGNLACIGQAGACSLSLVAVVASHGVR